MGEMSICFILDTVLSDLPSTSCSQRDLPLLSYSTPGPSLPNLKSSTQDRQDPHMNTLHLAAAWCHFWVCAPEKRRHKLSSFHQSQGAPSLLRRWGED